MKKLLFLFMILLPTLVFAQDSWYEGVKEKLIGDDAGPAVQAVKKNVADDERADWEFAVRLPVLVTPSGGDRQTVFMITDFWVFHNMSKGFLSFWGMGKFINDVSKKDKTGSYYGKSWDYKILGAGVQWYITKQKNYNIAAYGGFAQIMAEDGDGKSAPLGGGEVLGWKVDIPYRANDPFGWNFEIAYEMITAEHKENEITKSLGDFALNSWVFGIRIPL